MLTTLTAVRASLFRVIAIYLLLLCMLASSGSAQVSRVHPRSESERNAEESFPGCEAISDHKTTAPLKTDRAANAEIFFNRGKGCASGGHFALAIRNFTRAIRLKPDYAEAFKERSTADMYVYDYKGALRDMSRAIELRPGDADAISMRGSIYYQSRDYDRAIRDFSRSIQLNPAEWFTFWARGGAYYDKGDYDAAIRDFDEVIKRRCTGNVKDFDFFSHRGLAHLYKGDYERAIRDFDDVANRRQNASWCFYHRGLARFFMGQLRAAKEDFARFNGPDYDIWLYLTEAKLGEKASQELRERAPSIKEELKYWPGPVIQYYLGSITSAQLLSMARAGYGVAYADACCVDHPSAAEKMTIHPDVEGAACFYIAERLLNRGHSEEAKVLFQKAQQMADRNSEEYQGSLVELNRLKDTTPKEQPPK